MPTTRRSRAAKPVRYSVDPYQDLDSDAEPRPTNNHHEEGENNEYQVLEKPGSSSRQGPPKIPGQGESASDANPDSFEDEDEEEDEEEDDDDVYGSEGETPRARGNSQRRRGRGRISKESSGRRDVAALSSTSARVHRRHEFRAPMTSRKRRRRAASEDTTNSDAEEGESFTLKLPNPSVKLTYRPRIHQATGKRERLFTTYGMNTHALVIATGVRDRSLGVPAVPEEGSFEPNPFWQEGQDELVDLGDGMQRVERMEYCDATPVDGTGATAEMYMPSKGEEPIKCIIGPGAEQKILTFQRFGIFNLKESGEHKNGYILNAGGHVISMEWVPNRPKGVQYLAISTKKSGPDRSKSPEPRPITKSIYVPEPSPSCIQIWRFPTSEDVKPSDPPSIALALCHEWGYAQHLSWCPIKKTPKNEKELGLLGAVFRDGKLRIMRIFLPDDDTDGDCIFLKIVEPAFELSIKDSMCSSLAWISDHEIVAGTSTGEIAVWDLRYKFDGEFIPTQLFPLHQSYITQLATCYPSFPHHILTASMDGYCRLTSLLDPFADTIVNNRSRIAPQSITWVDALQAAVSSEEGAWIKYYPLRRFYSSTMLARHGGVGSSVASSRMHSFVLSGGTEGEAIFSNPARRMFHAKIKNYQQTWFQLEFAQSTGMFRINEGFKLEMKEPLSAMVHSTVYPEQSAIASVCWNPNDNCGGWATAGAACGLVRAEDITIYTE
ncbi:hypothetical protein HOY80DRAFT_51430 [Tuber brumale]|nr:hypothetical protein HOY80DRAFT_51430 [Tuber brumale]